MRLGRPDALQPRKRQRRQIVGGIGEVLIKPTIEHIAFEPKECDDFLLFMEKFVEAQPAPAFFEDIPCSGLKG